MKAITAFFDKILGEHTEALPSSPADEKNTDFADLLLCTALDLGEHMLKSGGEIHRIEDTIERVCRAYGARHVEVFTIPSLIVAAIRMPDGTYSSQTRRVYKSSNDLCRVERLNQISRKMCAELIPLKEVQEEITASKNHNPYPSWIRPIGPAFAAGGFAVFFGGDWLDGLAAAVIGIALMLIDRIKPHFMNQMSHVAIKSLVAGIIALLFIKMGFGHNTDKIMIGTIMLLIPGLALGNSLRDLLCGDIIAGTLQLVQSLLLAIMIAFGFGIALLLLGGI